MTGELQLDSIGSAQVTGSYDVVLEDFDNNQSAELRGGFSAPVCVISDVCATSVCLD